MLLFEGRAALPKSAISSMASRIPMLRRTDSSGERAHRQLIDCIRSKETDALIDAVDTGSEFSKIYHACFILLYICTYRRASLLKYTFNIYFFYLNIYIESLFTSVMQFAYCCRKS